MRKPRGEKGIFSPVKTRWGPGDVDCTVSKSEIGDRRKGSRTSQKAPTMALSRTKRRNSISRKLKGEIQFRVAPSLIARCEVELFGASMPRFAFRAYLGSRSFVNARRVRTFCYLATSWGQPPAGYQRMVDVSATKKGPHLTIQRSSCIGDSLLEPPISLKGEGYHVMTTDLGRAYGAHDTIEGTPFVNHIRLGGGLCAQAVCFMATALHQHETRGIYGVAEITALASDQDELALDLGGMCPDNICDYFNHPKVGLSANRQVIHAEGHDLKLKTSQFGEVLRSYILSDVPVIMLVDLGRMCGVTISKKNQTTTVVLNDDYLFTLQNGLGKKLETVETCRAKTTGEVRHHAVLVVGCKMKRDGGKEEPANFLINDPSTYPFLKVDVDELVNIRTYADKGWEEGTLGPIQFIPVTPQEVRLPLMDSPRDRRQGLAAIAAAIQANATNPILPQDALPIDSKGIIRLIDLRWCEDSKQINPKFDGRLADVCASGREILKRWVQGGEIPAKWCWIQYGPASIVGGGEVNALWIWDATAPPPSEQTPVAELREKYLLAVFVEEAGIWRPAYTSRRRLQSALLSSFHTGEIPAVKKEWPGEHKAAVDLYVFMQPEVDRWLAMTGENFGPPEGPNHPVVVMSEMAQNQAAIERWADLVCNVFRPEESPIIAVTSFVPEVSSPHEGMYEMALNTVRFLVEFAATLSQRGHHELHTVELVAGSRIGGIWPAQRGRYMATKMDLDRSFHRMLSILGRAMSRHSEIHADIPLALAIELEPGPMYLLRDWESLVQLCREIGKDPLLSKFVGVNLDIAHWRLAHDIVPERVWDTPEVRDRIVHSHVAGHHCCSHLGDLPLGDLNRAEEFRPWIDLLQRIAADWRSPELPRFSGYISLELEAAKDKNVVASSLAQHVKFVETGRW